MNVTVGRSSIAVIRISEQSRAEQSRAEQSRTLEAFKEKNVSVEVTAVP